MTTRIYKSSKSSYKIEWMLKGDGNQYSLMKNNNTSEEWKEISRFMILQSAEKMLYYHFNKDKEDNI